MALMNGAFGAFVVLVFFQSHCVSSNFNDCSVQVDVADVNSAESPIILKYQDGVDRRYLEILHPTYLNAKCLERNFYSSNGLASFACLDHHLVFPGLKDWPDNVTATSLMRSSQMLSDNFTVIASEYLSPFFLNQMSGPIKCTGKVEPVMKTLSDGQYQIGYQLNALDFLPIYYLTFTDQLTFAQANVLSTINRRPRIDENTENLRKGQVFKNLSITDPQLGNEQQLSSELGRKSKLLTENTNGDNYLVYGQLLSKDDLFYIPEQRATFFLENTVSIWKSINDGNWKMVGDAVRKLAYESITDLDVYSGTIECSTSNQIPIYLYNLKNFTKPTCVPKFLFKIALDTRPNSERGIAFITINDPTIQLNDDGSIPSDFKLCNKKSECDHLYPEFSSPQNGYTYCCDLGDFKPWIEIQKIKVKTKKLHNTMPLFGPFHNAVPA